MRTIRFLLQKEFRQIFRNRALLPILFVMPIVQLTVFPLAADYEVKNVLLTIVDHDHSTFTHQLVSKITASGYFKLVGYNERYSDAQKLIEQDQADLILEIPAGFERNLVRENEQTLFIAVNAINGVRANLGGAYLSRVLQDFNQNIRLDFSPPTRFAQTPTIDIQTSNWYNPFMNYKMFMVPGILAVLVTMVAGFMSSLNIVREKEIGTIEQINVTPIRKFHFIVGKLIPFWLIGVFVFTLGLFGVSRLFYGIVPLGSVALLYGFLSIYLVALLGFGLLISTYSDTQQQAMSIAFFFIMIFMLMSGLFTPIESMPKWAQVIAYLNPVTYFIDVMRSIVLKGSGFRDLQKDFYIIVAFAVVLNGWAILNYRKTA